MSAVDDVVQRAIETATAAFPTIMRDPAELRQLLVERRVELADLHVADLWLARACAAGDRAALAIFDRDYLAQVPAFLARHPARSLADDVRQALRERLLLPRPDAPPRIADYAGRGPLLAWLRVATLRAATNLGLARKREVRGTGEEPPATAAFVELPELRVLESRYRTAFRDAFRRAFEALPADERAVLRLHFLEGASVRTLAPLLGVSPATVGRRLLAVQERLQAGVLAELGRETDASVEDLESVVRALLSKLEVSLSALVR